MLSILPDQNPFQGAEKELRTSADGLHGLGWLMMIMMTMTMLMIDD